MLHDGGARDFSWWAGEICHSVLYDWSGLYLSDPERTLHESWFLLCHFFQ